MKFRYRNLIFRVWGYSSVLLEMVGLGLVVTSDWDVLMWVGLGSFLLWGVSLWVCYNLGLVEIKK